MRECITVILTVLISMTICTVNAAENLMPNPSFELEANGEPDSWSFRAWHDTLKNSEKGMDANGRTGKCVYIESTGNSGVDAAWTANVKVQPNSTYRLSAWIKTDNVRGAKGALFNIQGMENANTKAVTGTHDWTQVSVVFQSTHAKKVEINCLFGGWGTSTGKAWYDDISLNVIRDLDQLNADELEAIVVVNLIKDQLNTDELEATVVVNVQMKPKLYNPMIFGGFLEHFHKQVYGGIYDPKSPLSDDNGFRTDVIKALKELKVPVMRWPGGCYVDGYDWKNGVGDNRQVRYDIAWGVEDPYTFGTDEFVEYCRIMGWKPYICNNGNSTVQEMKDWVEYCNQTEGKYADMRKANGHIKPLNVEFWSVGNENYNTEFAPTVLKAAKAMKKIDPDVKVACPSRTWGAQAMTLLKTAGEYLDYISIHQYWVGNYQTFNRPDYLTCIKLSQGPESWITRTINTLEQAGYRGKIKISFDEWGLRSWHCPGFPRYCCMNSKTLRCAKHKVIKYDDPRTIRFIKDRDKSLDPSLYTMADALFAASFLNSCLRHSDDVEMANVSPLVNQTGPLYVHPGGIVKRTHFHTMAMYANVLGNHVGAVKIECKPLVNNIPLVDGIATVHDRTGMWSLALVNRHPSKNVECTVKFGDNLLEGSYEASILTGDSPDSYNDIEHPHRVVPKEAELTFKKGVTSLPPHSLTIVDIPVTE